MLLGQFNQKYFESLEGSQKVLPPNYKTIYYTILWRGIKVGIVGYFIPLFPKHSGFIQILIDIKFRGKMFAEQAMNMLIKKDKLDVLFATLEKTNFSSLKCLSRIGFKFVSKERMDDLRQKGFLEENELRLIKFCWGDLN